MHASVLSVAPIQAGLMMRLPENLQMPFVGDRGLIAMILDRAYDVPAGGFSMPPKWSYG